MLCVNKGGMCVMMETTPPDASGSSSDETGDTMVHSDPRVWDREDVRRWVRWASRTFQISTPRAHLLPDSGPALIELNEQHWTQVCGDERQGSILRSHLLHLVSASTGQPPPPPLASTVTETPQPSTSKGSEGEVEEVKNLLDQLKDDVVGVPWRTIEELWSETVRAGLYTCYHETGKDKQTMIYNSRPAILKAHNVGVQLEAM